MIITRMHFEMNKVFGVTSILLSFSRKVDPGSDMLDLCDNYVKREK